MSIPGVPTHKHISEREADGSWEDCTWDAGLEFYRDAIDSSVPATHAEAQALRAASGEPPTGGSNLGDFRRGVAARYHHTLPPAINAHDILAHLAPNWCATVQGSMKAFGSTHRLSAYDRNFDGAHDVYIANVGGKLYWCDPEAPTLAAVPVTVTPAEVQAFVNAFGGEAIVAPIQSLVPAGADMPTLTTYVPGYTANIKALSNIRSAPVATATKFRTVPAGTKEPVVLTGTVKGGIDPSNGSDVWYTWFKNGRWEYTAKDNVVDIKAPAGALPAYPDLSKELAASNVENLRLTTLTNAQKVALDVAAPKAAKFDAIDAVIVTR